MALAGDLCTKTVARGLRQGDLPLNFHPAAIRVSAGFTPSGADRATCDRPELVRVAQPIARCGEVSGISRWGEIAQRRMRTLDVVIIGPIRDAGSGVIEAEEEALIEKLVPHPAVEALTETVLHGLARSDQVPGDAALLRPGEHGVRRELGAVVRDDHSRLAALFDQHGQFARHPTTRDRGVRDRRQTLPGDVIDDVQDTESPAASMPPYLAFQL